MPGTIKVSVLELMDSSTSTSSSPTASKTSSLSLKVALGKKYYQTTRGEDLSLPVLSLRENLVFMLYDAEGILLWQTEMKTSLVVEKGTWDDKFSVNNGGIVHLRLQFLLSDDERLRIREMRNSAVKRKHKELLKGNQEGEKAGIVASYVAPGNEAAGASTGLLKQTDRDECNNQPSNPQMQEPEKRSEHESSINEAEYKVESAIENSQDNDSLDKQKDDLRSLTSTEAIEESTTSSGEAEKPVQSPQKKKLLVSNTTSNVRKMISTFESSVYQRQGQIPGTATSSITKADNGGSLKRTISVESNIKDMSSRTIRKSISLNMLSDINSHENSKVERPIGLWKQEQIPNARLASSIDSVMNINLPPELEVGEIVKVLGSDKHMGVKKSDNENMSAQLSSSAQSTPYARTDVVQKQIQDEDTCNLGRSAVFSNENEDIVYQIGKKGGISVESGFSKSIDSGEVSDISQKVYDSKGTPNETTPLLSNEDPRVLNATKHPFKGQRSVRFMGIDQSSRKGKSSNSDGARTGLDTPSYRKLEGLEAPKAQNNTTIGAKTKLDETEDCDIAVDHTTIGNTLLQIVTDKNKHLQKNENKNEEEYQLSSKPVESVNAYNSCGLWTCQNEFATGTIWKKLYCGYCIYHLQEQSDSQDSCESNEWFYGTEMFLFGTFGIWVPRHLCITTGSRELRNLADRCRICLGPISTKDNFSRESNDKEKMLCDSSIELKKTRNISHNSGKLDCEESVGSLTFPGSLFGKIIIIILACGTLVLRTK